METKQYEPPKMELVLIVDEDVVTASGEYPGGGDIDLD